MPLTTTRKCRRLNSCVTTQRYVSMATRSKQDIPESALESDRKSQKERAFWTPEDEAVLVQSLIKHKNLSITTEGGFKTPTWTMVVKDMNQMKTKGADKSIDACRTKWAKVREHIQVF